MDFYLKVALITASAGLLALLTVYHFSDFPEVSDIESAEHSDVSLTGKVVSIKNLDSVHLVEIADSSTAAVVFFDKRMVTFKEGDSITVQGEVSSYKGKKELIAERVILR